MTITSPYAAYENALATGFKQDPAQYQAVQGLERCYQQLLVNQPQIQGVYLWGPVGRGKTWLMDSFYKSLTVPAKRQHFHHFIRWVHRRLFQLTGQEDPLRILAHELAAEARVICLDELFINDIGDATLLGRLFQNLFAAGLVLVTTSNQHPDSLYENGFNRERLLPAIDAIKTHMQVLSVDGGEDHRLHPGEAYTRYWVNNPHAIAELFKQLTNQDGHQQPLQLAHLSIPVIRRTEQVLWCRYEDLCEQPLAATDFIELCDQVSHILLSDVPQLSSKVRDVVIARGTEDGAALVAAGDRELPSLSRHDDGVRRFIALVDECYDRNIPLYIDAAVPLNQLYESGALEFPFRRTHSRLSEMQLARFG